MVALIVGFSTTTSAFAQGPGPTATETIRMKLARIYDVERNSSAETAAIDSTVGHSYLSEKCLEALPGLTSSERVEFKQLLVDVVRVMLRKQISRILATEVKWGLETIDGHEVTVASVVKQDSNNLDVDWILVMDGSDWRLVDIVTENASMIRTWRRSFKLIYEKGGWKALSKKLHKVGMGDKSR